MGCGVVVYDTELFTGGHRTVSQVQDPASRREGTQTLTAEQRAHSRHQRRQAGTNLWQAGTNNAAMIKYVHGDHNRSTVIRKVRNDGKLGIRSDILPYKYKTLLITQQYYSLRQLLEPAASILKQESHLCKLGRYAMALGTQAFLVLGCLQELEFCSADFSLLLPGFI